MFKRHGSETGEAFSASRLGSYKAGRGGSNRGDGETEVQRLDYNDFV